MGFFSSLVKTVLPVAASVFLGEAAAEAIFGGDQSEPEKRIESAATAAVGGTPTGTPGITTSGLNIRQVEAALAAGVTTTAGAQALAAVPSAAAIAAAPGMKNVVTTQIITRNPAGQVIKTEMRRGRPFIMKSDITAAKRVFKQSRKLAAKLPKKTVKQSDAAALNDAIKQKMMQQIAGPSCPPKCP